MGAVDAVAAAEGVALEPVPAVEHVVRFSGVERVHARPAVELSLPAPPVSVSLPSPPLSEVVAVAAVRVSVGAPLADRTARVERVAVAAAQRVLAVAAADRCRRPRRPRGCSAALPVSTSLPVPVVAFSTRRRRVALACLARRLSG